MLLILFLMLLGMLLFSILLMLAERNHEKGHFSGPWSSGRARSLVLSRYDDNRGYGDKTPLSPLGRFITFVWMLMGVLLIALFTGTVASSITTA